MGWLARTGCAGAFVGLLGLLGLSLPTAALAVTPSATTTPRSTLALTYAEVPIQETGIVDWVQDGDTFRFIEDGQSGKVSVRLLGINAPEVAGFNFVHFPFDYCGGIAAQSELKKLLPVGTRVQLRSLSKASENRGRIQRSVMAFNPASGQYDIDVQAAMARTGLVMWFTVENEPTLSAEYRTLVGAAQAAHLGIWNPELCGVVEQPDAQLSVSVNWDAPGNDGDNLNGEFTIVRNTGTTNVDLSGWLLRDSSLMSWYTFPGGSVLGPNDYRVIHAGSGTAGRPNARDLYMGSPIPLFPNPIAGSFIGDGAYLLDKKTAYRAWYEYPCQLDCLSNPIKGKVIISKVNAVAPPGPPARRANAEYILLRNVSASAVFLDGYYLRRQISTFAFAPNTSIAPGASLKVRIGRGTPTASTQYWGRPSTLLNDQRDRVELLSNDGVLISAKQWG